MKKPGLCPEPFIIFHGHLRPIRHEATLDLGSLKRPTNDRQLFGRGSQQICHKPTKGLTKKIETYMIMISITCYALILLDVLDVAFNNLYKVSLHTSSLIVESFVKCSDSIVAPGNFSPENGGQFHPTDLPTPTCKAYILNKIIAYTIHGTGIFTHP